MKKIIIISSIFIISISCENNNPSLCDCLTDPEYTRGEKFEKCEIVFSKKYGTSSPSPDTMRNDYYNCKN